ncbi:MAG: helix-turn-helix domain-containing protein [Firmicutes bacterium]|nr:helix-turn-helix domain-containing protein [Bacillota bacterium]
MKFAERLKFLIDDSDKKILEIAIELGIPQQMLYSYKSGKTTAQFCHFILLADYFKCSVDYLVGRTGLDAEAGEKKTVYKECPPFSKRLKELFGLYKTTESRIYKIVQISRSRFHGWLSGKNEPSLPNLIKLAEYFDCTLDYLVGREK